MNAVQLAEGYKYLYRHVNCLSFTMDLAFEAVCKVGIEADKKSFGYQCNVGKPQTIPK